MILPIMDPVGTAVTAFSGWDTAGTVLALGFVFTLVAYYCYSAGLKRLEPSTVSVLIFVEVGVASIAGMLVYGEMLTPADLIGLVLILASVLMVEKGTPGEEEGAVR